LIFTYYTTFDSFFHSLSCTHKLSCEKCKEKSKRTTEWVDDETKWKSKQASTALVMIRERRMKENQIDCGCDMKMVSEIRHLPRSKFSLRLMYKCVYIGKCKCVENTQT
jgi:hypothetical protein